MNSNLGLIAVTALATLGVVAVIISAVWLTYIARTQQGKHDALVANVNSFFKDLTDHFNQKHNQLVTDVATDIANVKNDVATVTDKVNAAVDTAKADVAADESKVSEAVTKVESKL